jgi:dipeptidyl aminopeptidase/acylaminoacyl peptidase
MTPRAVRLATRLAAAVIIAWCASARGVLPARGAAIADRVALTPERAVQFRRISDLRFSPDGRQLVCVVTEPQDHGPVSHLWLADPRRNALHPWTSSTGSERAPRWSPDGRTLAYLSTRGGDAQIWLMPSTGGEGRQLTAVAGGIDDYAWSPDGSRLAFLAGDTTARDTSDAIVFDRAQDRACVWMVARTTGQGRRLTRPTFRIDEIAWPQSGRLLVVASEHPARETWDAAIYRVGIADGRFTLVSRPSPPFTGLIASPDGTALAFVGTAAHGPIPHDLFVEPAKGGEARNVSRSVDRAVIEARWQDNTNLIARMSDGFRTVLYRCGRTSGVATRIDLPLSARAFDVARDGTLAYVGVGFDRLPELYWIPAGEAPRPIGHVQDAAWDHVALTDASYFRCASFDGTSIEAALLMPARRPAGKPPLVLLVHGGPNACFAADYYWFNAWAQLLVAHGDAVLMVNPRGSTGYGEAFVKANRADWGGGDYRDLIAALDHVVATGSVDPSRLAIGGWSYGGEMSAWAIGHTRRFRAAVVGGGVFDLAAELETESDPAGDEWHFGTPWTDLAPFTRNSPMTWIQHARTPTLILHGAADRDNPPGQALGLYRALQHLGVESELVMYPNEPHLPRQPKHQVDAMRRMLRWYDDHLR